MRQELTADHQPVTVALSKTADPSMCDRAGTGRTVRLIGIACQMRDGVRYGAGGVYTP